VSADRYAVKLFELTSTLHHTGDHLGLPFGIAALEQRLVVIDGRAEKNIHVVDARTGELEVSIGDIGEGPAEFRAPWALVRGGDRSIWVFDAELQRTTRLNLDELHTQTAWAEEMVTFQAPGGVMDGAWTDQNTLIVDGTFADAHLAILNRQGERVGTVGDIPVEQGYPALAQRQSHMTLLAASPDLSRVVTAKRWWGEIDILASDGALITSVEPPIPVSPVLVGRRGTLMPGRESPSAYVDLATSESFIYALFSGLDRAQFGDRSDSGRDVHIFDWSGRLVAVFRLDQDAFRLDVDETAGRLYTIRLAPVPSIDRYDLPEEFYETSGG